MLKKEELGSLGWSVWVILEQNYNRIVRTKPWIRKRSATSSSDCVVLDLYKWYLCTK